MASVGDRNIAGLAEYLDVTEESLDLVTVDLLYEAAGTFRRDWYRAELLADLIPHLSPARLGEVVALLPQLTGLAQVLLVAPLAGHLDAYQFESVFRSAMAMPASTTFNTAVKILLPHLTPVQRDVAVAEAVRQLSRTNDVKQSLAALAPHLTRAELVTALEYVEAAAVPAGQRATALTWIAAHLSRQQRTEALELALRQEDGNSVAHHLGMLAPHLDPEQLERALSAANDLAHAGHRARALTGLIPHLSEDRRTAAIAAALTAVLTAGATDSISNIALPDLVPHLTPEQIQTVLDMVHTHRHVAGSGWHLGVLAPYLNRAQLTQALETASAQTEPDDRYRALVTLIAHLAVDDREPAVDQAIATLRTHPRWAGVAPGLVAAMTPSQRDTLFDIAAGRADHANIVAALAAHLRPDQRDRALAAALDTTDDNDRIQILLALAPHLDPQSVDTALSALADVPDPARRADVLRRIAADSPTHAPTAAAAAVRAARDIPDAETRATALTALADLVPPDQRPAVAARAYTAAMAIDDEPDRYRRLAALIPACLPSTNTSTRDIASSPTAACPGT
jgi:hypothetical protein